MNLRNVWTAIFAITVCTAAPLYAADPALGPTKPDDSAEVVGEAIGTLSGAYLNQAYLSLGLLADAEAGNVYKLEEARELLDAHLGLVLIVEKQLQALAKASSAEKDEVETLRALLKIAGLIKSQGQVLHNLWNGDEKQAAVWDKLRQETGDELDKFFGDDETPPK
jgi:hypothetical protein